MRRSCLLVCLVLVLGVPSPAQVLHVPGEHPSIQAAIDAADPGDTVLVKEGTYFENINFKGKAITVASYFLVDSDTAHIPRTVIDGSRAVDLTRASVVSLRSGEDSTSVLCGFTVTGGTGSYLPDVHTEPNDMKNWRNMCGGGIVMHRAGGKIIHNIIEHNQVQTDTVRGAYGAGILANVNEGLTAVIRSNIIRNNQIRKNQGWGAGICLFGGRILVEHNVILNNSIEAKGLAVGAGIFYQNDSTEGGARQVAIRNNIIARNSTFSRGNRDMGGGIGLCYGREAGIMEINHNIICENHSLGIGGGLYSFIGRGKVKGNLIFDNRAEMYGDQIATEQEQRLTLLNNHLWSGTVWMASRDGLNMMHLAQEYAGDQARNLRERDPAYTEWFSVDPYTGGLYPGDREGMLSFHPGKVPLNSFAPPMMIMDFRRSGYTSSGPEDLHLDLSYKENFLNFKFSILELSEIDVYAISPRGLGFRYFMEGWDQDTLMTGMEMTALYQNLKPGRYRLWVARSPDPGIWDPDPESMFLRIRIHPPWYRSGLAIGSYSIFLVLLGFGIARIRTARLRKEKRHLELEVSKRTKELREKNEQIMVMQRLKTRFFTDVSHEIRTPLSLISGPLERLISQDYRDPRILRWLSLIRRNSQRLVQLINQLLDISRLDAGHMKLVMEKSDVCAHLRLLAGEFYSMAESRDIRYAVDIPEENLPVCYDREKLEKICTNLLSNAFKFTSPGGIVTFRLKLLKGAPGNSDPRIRILVADTGRGIPQGMQEKIFDRFYRGENDSSRFSSGTGIGLSLTRELVRIMHGEIRIKSKVGEGSIFMVTFPAGCSHLRQEEYIMKEPGEKAVYESPAFEGQKLQTREEVLSDRNLSILVVEDNRDLQDFLLENLAAEFRVSGALNGKQGVSMAVSQLPDLVITDVMMPGAMDGMELCRKLKSDERTSHIPVVMLTAKATGRDKITGLEQGADDYMVKPFSMDELLVRIRNLLKQRDRLRKKYSGMIGLDWDRISVTTLDEQFLKKILGIISENLSDFNFQVSSLQEKMSMSREHMFRKLKALTGESPSSLIRVMRLKAAAKLLENGQQNITRVAIQVGFSNPSYFSQCFKAYFGVRPSEYSIKKPASYSL